jgi:hypothetical protein
MDKELVDQLDDVIASLLVAEANAKRAMQTMRQRRVFLGLNHNYLDEEITRLIGKVRHTRLLAERRASSASADAQDHSPRPEVDGRVVALNDEGDALVVQPVQDAPALPSVVPAEVAGGIDGDGESAADAAPESVIMPPALAQPPAVDDASAVSLVTPEAVDGPPPVVPPDTDET